MAVNFLLALVLVFELALAHKTYTNPVLNSNFPDPGILALPNGAGYVCLSTTSDPQAGDSLFPIMFSTDLVNWKLERHVFNGSQWPAWVYNSTWAPEIHLVNGNYHVYYSAKQKSDERYVLGLAISKSGPYGPYEDLGRPLYDETSIDVTWFRDPKTNKTYLSWKKQHDKPIGNPSFIQIQQVEQDGFTFTPGTSPTTVLESGTGIFDAWTVEGSWIIYKDPHYFLFHSTSAFFLPSYDIKVARSKNILGPYTTWDKKVIGTSFFGCAIFYSCPFLGPGHGSLVQTPNGDYWLAYHAWLDGHLAANPPGRVLNIDKIRWIGDGEGGEWPQVGRPSDKETDAPIV